MYTIFTHTSLVLNELENKGENDLRAVFSFPPFKMIR